MRLSVLVLPVIGARRTRRLHEEHKRESYINRKIKPVMRYFVGKQPAFIIFNIVPGNRFS